VAVIVRAPGSKRDGLGSGLVGDHVGDRRHHGGDDQAVYAYAREDYDWWGGELGRELPGGVFGDNLTTFGVDVSGAVVGETWRVGEQLVLAVTAPRIPCATFHAVMGLPGWTKRFTREARPGAYLRVVEPGPVGAGDAVAVTDRPAGGITIAEAFRAFTSEPALLEGVVSANGVGDGLRDEAAQLLRRRSEVDQV